MKSITVTALRLVLGGLLLAACGSGTPPPTGKKCNMNSDCNNPLSCTFGTCHVTCVEARDCPNGQNCVKSPAGNVCQLPEEARCEYRSQCMAPLTCALDRRCRSECKEDVDCPTKTQKCVKPDLICAEPAEIDPATNRLRNAQATPVPEIPDGGIPGAEAGTAGGSADAGDGGGGSSIDANLAGTDGPGPNQPCPSPQTTFGNIAQGDSNPGFTSGVGVRNASEFLIFTGYSGPAGVDAGAGDDGGVTGNAIWVQSLDLNTGKSRGPAVQLLQATDGPSYGVRDIAIAPTGEIVVLHSRATTTDGRQSQLYASFFNTLTPDAGPAGVTLVRTVQVESALLASPHAVWSTASQSFVLSWKYYTTAWFLRTRKFLRDGRGAGGDTNVVPSPLGYHNDLAWDEGRAGTSGDYLGVGYRHYGNALPYLTVLDAQGIPVGDYVQLSTKDVSRWVVVGGTTKGFVALFSNGGMANGVFVPISADGKVSAAATDAGAPAFATFGFPSTASTAQAISDDMGGFGGTGAVFLEPNGASFLYVTADGSQRMATGTVISSSDGSQATIANYQGSFAVSLFDSKTKAAQVIASGCR